MSRRFTLCLSQLIEIKTKVIIRQLQPILNVDYAYLRDRLYRKVFYMAGQEVKSFAERGHQETRYKGTHLLRE